MENIADPADADGSAFGFPQISSEFIVTSDPEIIFLANVLYGESAETVSLRPGWAVMTAVQSGHIAELDSDVASRGGPRIVDFAELISNALAEFASG
jgi:iron complex transport system substrate-binding protein